MCKIIQLTRRFYILGSASNKMRRFFFFVFFFPPGTKRIQKWVSCTLHYTTQRVLKCTVLKHVGLDWRNAKYPKHVDTHVLPVLLSSCQNNFGVWVFTNHGHIQMYTCHTSLQYVDFTRIWVRSVSPDGRDGGRITAGINSSAFLILKPLNIF